jgi:hypothetical protein
MSQLKPGQSITVSVNTDGTVNYEVKGQGGAAPIDPVPAEWQTIGKEGEEISVTTPILVRFGDPASNKWSAEKLAEKSFTATSGFFGGDPAFGVAKVVQKNISTITPGGGSDTPGPEPDPIPPAPAGNPNVSVEFNQADTIFFLKGGQSNADSRNGNIEVNTNPNILEFRAKTFDTKDGAPDVSTPLTFELVQLNDPTGAGYTRTESSSFVRGMKQLAASLGKRIVLCKIAQGNSGISQHLPDDGKNAGNPNPHNIHFVAKSLADNFYQLAASKGWKVFTIGSFWQGESDAAWGTPDETYFTKFDQVMNLYQSAYGCKAVFVTRVGYDLSGPWPASNSEKIMSLQSLYCLLNNNNTIESTKAVATFTPENGLMSSDKVHASGNGQDVVMDKEALSVSNYLLKGEKTFEPEPVPALASKYTDLNMQAKYRALLMQPATPPTGGNSTPTNPPASQPPTGTAAIDIDFTKGIPSNIKAVNNSGQPAQAITSPEGLVLDQSYHLLLQEAISSSKIIVEITCKAANAVGGLGFITGGRDLTGSWNLDKIRIDIGTKELQFGPGVLPGQDLGVTFSVLSVNFGEMNIYKFIYDGAKVDVTVSNLNGLVLFSGSKQLSGAIFTVQRIGAGGSGRDTNFKGTIKAVKISTF